MTGIFFYISMLLMAMLLIRFLVVWINYVSLPFLPPVRGDASQPMVSILIPARNEAANLQVLLSALKEEVYPNLEIIVCNDNSTDTTAEVLELFRSQISVLKWFNGKELPQGWVGKNYACHQLAQQASGQYLLFLDADVRIGAGVAQRAADFMMRKKLSLLSLFPQQIMQTAGEKVVVPLMNWILLSMLPLIAVRIPWFSSLAAANGQFMMFRADDYKRYQWHLKVKGNNVDDILIARLMKKMRLKMAVLVGNGDVFCRMYANKDEAVAGFARNIHHYFSGNRVWMLFFVAMEWLRLPLLALMQQWTLFAVGVIMVFMMKVMVAQISRQEIRMIIGNHFTHLWFLWKLAKENLTLSHRRMIEWKGRQYQIK